MKRAVAGPRGVALPVGAGKWQHGSVYAYDKRGCRCDECMHAYRLHRRGGRLEIIKAVEVQALVPWNVGERRVLARTCTGCGRLLDAQWFSRRRTGTSPLALRPTCVRCTNDAKARYVDGPKRVAQWKAKRGAVALLADRSGYEWTGPDDAVVLRTDLSLEEMARLLGRTIPAVSHRRTQICAPSLAIDRLEPVETWRIGTPCDTTGCPP